MTDIIDNIKTFPQIETVYKINNITLIGEYHCNETHEKYYELANYLRSQYKSCFLSLYKTEILIEDYNYNENNNLNYLANYLSKNNCNVTKCDYRKKFPFYLSIIKKDIKNIIEIIEKCNNLFKYIDKKEYPIILIHNIKLMENSMDFISLKNDDYLVKIIKTNLNKNINGKSYKQLLIHSFNNLKNSLVTFRNIKNPNLDLWDKLKNSFEIFCETFILFFSFILDWVFLYHIENHKNSNVVIYAGSEHINHIYNVLIKKNKQHKLMKHMEFL